MEKKLKQVSEGQGFVCKDLEEKERIWQRLTDAGYPMYDNGSDENYKHIIWDGDNEWVETNKVTDPLNESDFFDEWTPQAGEIVEVWNHKEWEPHVFVVEWNNEYWYQSNKSTQLFPTKYIRQIKSETMTLQEVRDALGKPNLIITE